VKALDARCAASWSVPPLVALALLQQRGAGGVRQDGVRSWENSGQSGDR
jgi:hypothetical protein